MHLTSAVVSKYLVRSSTQYIILQDTDLFIHHMGKKNQSSKHIICVSDCRSQTFSILGNMLFRPFEGKKAPKKTNNKTKIQ